MTELEVGYEVVDLSEKSELNVAPNASEASNQLRIRLRCGDGELVALARKYMRPAILSFRSSLISFLSQQQQTFANPLHNSRFASQILYPFKKAQIPHF